MCSALYPFPMLCRFIDPEMGFSQFTVCATLGDYEQRKKQILSSPVIIAMLSTSGEVSWRCHQPCLELEFEMEIELEMEMEWLLLE